MKRLKKARPRHRRLKTTVDPVRLALAALERIRVVLRESGREERLGHGLADAELEERRKLLWPTELPASYAAAMREASRIGEPERLLSTVEMATKGAELIARGGQGAMRYLPFCEAPDALYCFDREVAGRTRARVTELAVVKLAGDEVQVVADHFGEWLDVVADEREEALETAAKIPAHLSDLIQDLGFRFETPIVGRLETGDVAAVESLVGSKIANEVRGEVDRLFDSSGKASLVLNVDEFTLVVSLRTGMFVLEAEDVFRWLRSFRDDNYLAAGSTRSPGSAEPVRDLRAAKPEPPLVLRGVMRMPPKPAKRYLFRSATGHSANDFYVLGRTKSTSDKAPSVILHVVNGEVVQGYGVDLPLNEIYVTPGGELWGLGPTHALRFVGGKGKRYPLIRPTAGRSWWYGIGGADGRIYVWGAGALLVFDGERFVPFTPDAELDEGENVVSLTAHGPRIDMLVCGDRMGAVAHFDGKRWLPIAEDAVMDGVLLDLDASRNNPIVLEQNGKLFRKENSIVRPFDVPRRAEAFAGPGGEPRRIHGIRSCDEGFFFATDGGVIASNPRESVFYAAEETLEPAHLTLLGADTGSGLGVPGKPTERRVSVVAVCGPHVWMLFKSGFAIVDMSDW